MEADYNTGEKVLAGILWLALIHKLVTGKWPGEEEHTRPIRNIDLPE